MRLDRRRPAPDLCLAEFAAVFDRVARRFAKCKPLSYVGESRARMAAGLERKNCWIFAERRRSASPKRPQHLLARPSCDACATTVSSMLSMIPAPSP